MAGSACLGREETSTYGPRVYSHFRDRHDVRHDFATSIFGHRGKADFRVGTFSVINLAIPSGHGTY